MTQEDMTDVGFMDIDVDSAQERPIAPDNDVQEVAITGVLPVGKKHYVQVMLEMFQLDKHKRIKVFITYPKPDDDEEKKENKILRIKKFMQAFGITTEEQKDPSTWEGKTAKVTVGVETDEEQIENYGEANKVKIYHTKA